MREICQTSAIGFVLTLLLCAAAEAQNVITPDDTLGDETSVVEAFNANIDLITGGATRAQNLFHSFEVFGVDEARAAYFITASDAITNIFARITGDSISEIKGFLGTRQRSGSDFSLTSADLFLINPNGIVFGGNAALDIGGSFTAATASGVQFGDSGSFSATDPATVSSQLTVNSSVYLFEQGRSGNIESRFAQPNNETDLPAGLLVPNGETISFLAEKISLSGSGLYAPSGQIVMEAKDLFVTDQSRVDVGIGGEIDIKVSYFEISDSSLLLAGLNNLTTNAPTNTERGNISIIAETVRASGASAIGSFVDLEDRIFSGGADIVIAADLLLFTDGSQLVSRSFGLGDSGDIDISAREAVFEGSTIEGFSSGIFSDNSFGSVGNGGDIEVNAGRLSIINGAVISASSFGVGNAGNITVEVFDHSLLQGTNPVNRFGGGVRSTVERDGNGNGGNIFFSTGSLDVVDGAQITAGTFGNGNAGDVTIEVVQTARFVGEGSDGGNLTGAFTSVGEEGLGSGGNLLLFTGNLEVTDGAQLSASSFGVGDAGNVILEIAEVARFDGSGLGSSAESGAFSNVEASGSGDGGDLLIFTEQLDVVNGARLSASNLGSGDAGDVRLSVTNRLVSRDGTISTDSRSGSGGSVDIIGGSIILLGDSDITTAIERGGLIDNSGSISLNGKFLIAINDSDFIAFTADGIGGNIAFNDTVVFIDAKRLSQVEVDFETETLDGNNQVDIAASGQSIQIEVVPLVESASYLPADGLLTTETIVARSCIGQKERTEGSLVVTGDAGTPQQPEGESQSVYATGTVRTTLENALESSFQEPENVYQLADGRLVLSRSCEN